MGHPQLGECMKDILKSYCAALGLLTSGDKGVVVERLIGWASDDDDDV